MTRANVRKIDEKLIKFFLQKHKIICCIMNSTRKAKVENKQIFTFGDFYICASNISPVSIWLWDQVEDNKKSLMLYKKVNKHVMLKCASW